MKRPIAHSLLTAAFVVQASAVAQVTYEPNIGQAQGAGNDTITRSLPLGFSFPMPGGAVVSAVDVDSNGRVLPGAAGVSMFVPGVTELLSGPASLCPFWNDLDFVPSNAGDLFYRTTGSTAFITYHDVVLWGGVSAPFTVQLQLFDDGRFAFLYDGRVPPDIPLVGLSSGGGTLDPGGRDLSTAPLQTTGSPTVYEDFLLTTGFDLAGQALEFVPDGQGGYAVQQNSAMFAVVEEFGRACPRAITFIPNAGTGYAVTRCARANCWESTASAASLGFSMDDEMSGALGLGFSFALPGGLAVTDIDVDVNGRIVMAGSDPSDFSPTVAEFLADPTPTIAPLWTDLDISGPVGGDVLFETRPGLAVVTWESIAQFGFDTRPLTFQVQLRPDGSITFVYADTTGWTRTARSVVGVDALVGVSAGSGASDPGASDLLSLPLTSAGSEIYAFVDGIAGEQLSLQLTTRSLSVPRPGVGWNLRIDGVAAGTSTVSLLIGFSNPMLDLSQVPSLGLGGCTLYVVPAAPAVPLQVIGRSSSTLPLQIGPMTQLLGFDVFAQAVAIVPGANNLGIVLGSAARGTIGF